MRRRLVALVLLGAAAAVGEDVFGRQRILELAGRVNEYQKRHPMQEEDRGWIRGTYYTGVMAMARASGEAAYREQAMAWGERNAWQPGTDASGANVLTCAQTYFELYLEKPRAEMIAPVVEHLNSGKKRTPSGEALWYLERNQRYADSLYVGPPALAMLARITGDGHYRDVMNALFWDVEAELFDPESGLLYRDKTFLFGRPAPAAPAADPRAIRKSWIHTRTARGKKVLWSRGNGWVFAGIPRILDNLAANDPMRAKYVALFRTMAESLAARQGADGLWRMNLDDAEEYPQPETSGTGFFCYGMAWGVRNGLLERARYLPVARKAWAGLARHVSAEGKVLWGQPVGSGPYEIDEQDTQEYVSGTLLLAASEMAKL
jgi:rhamnogalacturonyl hydrolase YesR